MDLLPPVSTSVDLASQSPAVESSAPQGPPFKSILAELGSRMDRGEASVNAVANAAPKLGPGGELLALQAGVYRYAETFEVAAKLVDKASSAVKTTLQGQ